MRLIPASSALVALTLAACSGEPTTTATTTATEDATPPAGAEAAMARAPVGASANAPLTNGEGALAGSASFRQGPQGVVIRVEATGLTPGWHGIHLHAVGTCDTPGFTSAGSHVHGGSDPAVHGLLNADATDSGDLPNVYADAQGRVNAEIFTPFARLADTGPGVGLMDTDGSAILIHAGPDDYSSQPIGGSGDRVACGVLAAG
ncbi:MAG: superoxide dismutase family protein [Alphaproteobacteria bacterium]|nr:superoxide dismutase family protein [Alphaproteobacteria bacterium]MBU2379948.1 superoxide dismutase family protein [Alphaproteobacteria bacterium]